MPALLAGEGAKSRRGWPKSSRPGEAGACGILAGDLNLRDDEVRAAQKSLESQAFGDAWSYCGAPEAERWTWDTTAPWSVA